MASNYYSCGPKHKIRRWDSKKGKHVKICKPLLAEAFTEGMAGTERCEQLVSLYRADHKTGRWYKRLFYHFAIDVTLANAFLLYRTKHPDTTLFDYKLSVA